MHYAFLMDRTWNEMRDFVEGVSTFIQAGKRGRNIIPVYKDFFLLRLTTFKYHSNLYFLLYRTSLLRIKYIYVYTPQSDIFIYNKGMDDLKLKTAISWSKVTDGSVKENLPDPKSQTPSWFNALTS